MIQRGGAVVFLRPSKSDPGLKSQGLFFIPKYATMRFLALGTLAQPPAIELVGPFFGHQYNRIQIVRELASLNVFCRGFVDI